MAASATRRAVIVVHGSDVVNVAAATAAGRLHIDRHGPVDIAIHDADMLDHARRIVHMMTHVMPRRRHEHAVRKSRCCRRKAEDKTGDKKTACKADGTQTHETFSRIGLRLNTTASLAMICAG